MDINDSGILSGHTSQVYTVKNPLAFIYNATTPYDWYANSATYQNNNLWSSIKSTYDPCPQGWQVPTDATVTFGDFSTTTMTVSGSGTNVANGRIYSHMAWFPMAGYRHTYSGALNIIGGAGYCWSNSISETKIKAMNFSLSGINPNYTNYRAYGFSVRCVQE